MFRPRVRKVSKDKYEIGIIGNRDPRGEDNEIIVEVNEKDELVITVPKAQRCYAVEEVKNEDGRVKIIAR